MKNDKKSSFQNYLKIQIKDKKGNDKKWITILSNKNNCKSYEEIYNIFEKETRECDDYHVRLKEIIVTKIERVILKTREN